MYVMGAFPNKDCALVMRVQWVRDGERPLTDVKVYQEIRHRCTAIRRLDAIDAAFGSLDAIADAVLTFGISEVPAARTLLESLDGLSARDALHVAVNAASRHASHSELRSGVRCLAWHRSSVLSPTPLCFAS